MTSRFLALAATSVLVACAPAATFPPPVTPVPTGADTVVVVTPATPVATTGYTLETLPRDWHLAERGIELRRAERELLAGRQPRRTVVVAVIDGGVDTAHVDLRGNLWRNEREVAGNRRDDDGNGYIDDVYGWNFLGGSDGRSVDHETLEVTRLYVRCRNAAAMPADLRAQCGRVTEDFQGRVQEAEATLAQVRNIEAMLATALPLLRAAAGTDSLTTERVRALRPTDNPTRQAQAMYLQMAAQGITPAVVAEAKEHYEESLAYNLNPDYNPRDIVGDVVADTANRRYGNRDITGPDARHGTHVAGIIGAMRGNDVGIDGIAPRVQIMGVRAVPNGDERDKDIANAIRYAADNGAHIINMSFGKGYSPEKHLVDEAAAYAIGKGVLLVHAAGNEGADLTTAPNFPTPVARDGRRLGAWLEVGATSWHGADSLVATFSNYGQNAVDVFAPGVDILSTVPGGDYERESGTSMAAPVVSGVAALLMSYYPSLTAADVKRIILETATKRDIEVILPGGEGRARFATLSSTGAVVNAYEALKRAEAVAASRP
jgi:subtilisin family serine protease